MPLMSLFTTIIAGVVLAASLAAQGTKPTGTKPPGTKPTAAAVALQGTWLITSINGKAAPEEFTLTFTGDKYAQAVGGTVNERGTIKVDATKKPMTIDLMITEGTDAGKTQLGVFEVSGDTLRANFNTPDAKERPASLKEGALIVEGKKQKKS